MIERTILSYDQDEDGEWRVLLDCGHRRHLRHDPPRESRPALSDPKARAETIGQKIGCGRCHQRLIPDGYEVFKSTPVFDQDSIPKGLLKDHSLKKGVWGRLQVLEGTLLFVEGESEMRLEASQSWVVLPEILHYVEPVGPVRIRVDFLKT